MQHKTLAIAVSLLNSRITCHTPTCTRIHTHTHTRDRAWQCPRANSNSIPEHKLKLISIIWKCGAHKSQELNFQLPIRERRRDGEKVRVCGRKREREKEWRKRGEEEEGKPEVDYQEKLSISVVISGSQSPHTHHTQHTHAAHMHTYIAHPSNLTHTHTDTAALLTFVSSRSLKQTKCE